MNFLKKVLNAFLLTFLFLAFPLQFAFAGNPPDAAQSSLVATSAGSDTAPADGSSQTSMTLTLKDSGGVALAGDTVRLVIPSDSTAVISPTSATLDSNGQAVFTITSTQAGRDNINITDTTTSTTLTALGVITITPYSTPTPTPDSHTAPCTNQPPVAAPNFFQLSSVGSQATLYFTQPPLPFTGFTISYGLSQTADTYATSFSQGFASGVTKYSINSLTPKTTYYFKVRADNGCAPGPWSNVLSTNKPLSKLPSTGPSNIFVEFGLGGAMLFALGMFFVIF